jgi:hypothetical protein
VSTDKSKKPTQRKFLAAVDPMVARSIVWVEAEVVPHGQHAFRVVTILNGNRDLDIGCTYSRATQFRTQVLAANAFDDLTTALGCVLLGAAANVQHFTQELAEAEKQYAVLTRTVEELREKNGACIGSPTRCKCITCRTSKKSNSKS